MTSQYASNHIIWKSLLTIMLLAIAMFNAYGKSYKGESTGDVTISNDDNATIPNGETFTVNGNLTIEKNSSLTVGKNSTLIVYGNLELIDYSGNEKQIPQLYVSESSIVAIKGDAYFGGIINSKKNAMAELNGQNATIVVTGSVTTWRNEQLNNESDNNIQFYINTNGTGNVENSKDSTQYRIDKETNEVLQKIAALLPITLNYFTASQDEEEIHFEWQTAAEVNNDFFTVEYSIDGVNFNELLRENGNGTTSQTNDYSATISANDFFGITYFRLKQTDFNGEFSYSDIQILNVSNSESVSIYPSRNSQTITISGDFEQISFCDTYGKTISLPQLSENSFSTNSLIPGIHYVIVSTNNKKQVLPFVKQ